MEIQEKGFTLIGEKFYNLNKGYSTVLKRVTISELQKLFENENKNDSKNNSNIMGNITSNIISYTSMGIPLYLCAISPCIDEDKDWFCNKCGLQIQQSQKSENEDKENKINRLAEELDYNITKNTKLRKEYRDLEDKYELIKKQLSDSISKSRYDSLQKDNINLSEKINNYLKQIEELKAKLDKVKKDKKEKKQAKNKENQTIKVVVDNKFYTEAEINTIRKNGYIHIEYNYQHQIFKLVIIDKDKNGREYLRVYIPVAKKGFFIKSYVNFVTDINNLNVVKNRDWKYYPGDNEIQVYNHFTEKDEQTGEEIKKRGRIKFIELATEMNGLQNEYKEKLEGKDVKKLHITHKDKNVFNCMNSNCKIKNIISKTKNNMNDEINNEIDNKDNDYKQKIQGGGCWKPGVQNSTAYVNIERMNDGFFED